MPRRSSHRRSEPRRPDPGERAPEERVLEMEIDIRKPIVGVVMGSDSDLPTVQLSLEMLEEFDVPYEVRVLSAHRTPEQVHQYASTARLNGLRILIAAAGGAAHLAGVLASLTTIPVVGIPIRTDSLGGQDSLYSTVQMPAGVPVATVAIGDAGARNAALLAVQILALGDEDLHARLLQFRADQRRSVAHKNEVLRQRIAETR